MAKQKRQPTVTVIVSNTPAAIAMSTAHYLGLGYVTKTSSIIANGQKIKITFILLDEPENNNGGEKES